MSSFSLAAKGLPHSANTIQTHANFVSLQQILRHSRENSTKVIFLITDGYSNGGDPRPIAASLRDFGVEIFTFGIWQGNIRELNDMASTPKEEHCYLLHSFEEFEALARRALHEDLPSGSFIQEDMSHCSYLCEAGKDCCDRMASCKCGTHTGQFECICEKGYYGEGLQYECTACPSGTYKPEGSPGGISTCLPCPDENHTSPPGSTSLEDCVCKEGYRASGQTCEVVHCPALRPPENGYFVQNTCNNHFNAACGVRCNPGFDLVGSSILLCLPNGLWSGSESSCRVRTCPHLRQPKHGRISCSTKEMSYKTVCLVTCDEGYRLEGSAKLTCQANTQWDGLEPRCVERHCPTFQKPKGVIIFPASCGKQPARPGTICQLSCRRGFILSGVREEVRCTTSGKWSARVQTAVCKDVEAPQISCPKDIEAKTQEQQDSANITWQIPTANDNSGEKVSIHVHPAFTPPYLFPIGDVAITYTAVDLSSNQASCTFHVKVVDVEPPSIDWCRSPPPIQVSEKEHAATWDEPQFSDNSGAVLIITRSHTPGDLFPHGETIVQYTATDPSGNNRTCDIHVVIKGSPCEVPFTPINGDFICTKDSAGVNCTLSCLEGYDFTEGSTENYYCAYEDGIWRPPYSTEWPDCAIKRFANHGFKSFEMLYKATRCDDTDLLKKFSEAFEITLGKMVPSFCSDADDIDCRLEDLTKKYCLEYNYDYENGFAIGPGGWGAANRLDYSYDDFLDSVQETPSGASKARSSRMKRSAPLSNHKIKLIFNITASVPLPSERNDTLELENQQRLIMTLETITNQLKRILNEEPMYSFQLETDMLVAESNSLETEKAFLFCRPGSVLRGRMCVNCPLGTYYSLKHSVCESCFTGSYQDEEGQLECKLCPAGTYTEYPHSRSSSECKAQCKQGTYSSNGLETCESCPLGSYQPAFGSRSCLSCPENTSTVKRGAVDISACGVPCPVGEFSRSGLTPCYPCPRDYYQPNPGKSFCLSCPFYGTTASSGAGSITDCSSFSSTFSAAEESVVPLTSPGHIKKNYEVSSQVFHECFLNPCHNSGTCQQLGRGYVCLCPSGYTGLKCETDIDECSSLPCLNGGICKDLVGQFVCECPSGYTGQLCEENINECNSSPCLNKGTCIDGLDGYHCTCVKGYTGLHCETEVNECQPSPCLNNAVCEDQVGGFLCKCPPGFLGTRCEKNMDECLSQPCKNGATCKDGASSFRCQCATGFTGPFCELNINECHSNPCRNQATCVDELNSYSCKCRPGFSGSRCEIDQSSGFNLDFEVSGIYGYAMLDGVLPPLHAVTCTFWMKSSDTTNYGTPISYAVENGSDNTFLLTDYNGWVLYVNGKEKITDCPSVNDGSWHHIAITWTSANGAWKVYIDGKLSDGGVGLSVGSAIPGGGALVLGQEQDKKGEGFNPAESFVGSISQLNLWDYVLSPQQVKSLATSCPEELRKGNVLAWADFLSGIVGKVKIDSKSIFCSDCPSLEGTVPHLRTVSTDLKPGSKISLFCDPGFQMVGNPVQYCLNQGQWTQPLPHCERISCGVPPPLENGFYSAEDFHAGSTVTYQCNNGYYLLGDSRMFCTDNGSWNGISPSCLGEINLGKYCVRLFQLHERLLFPSSQSHSYTLAGPDTIECLANGKWNGSNQQCLAVSCDEPPNVEHASPETAHRLFGDIAFYYCSDGYSLADNSQLLCNAQGKWVPPEGQAMPRCIAHFCEKPPSVSYSILESVSKAKFAAGSVVSFKCTEGFVLNTSAKIECLRGGQWSPSPMSIRCIPVRCGEPPSILNGYASGSNYSFGAIVAYSCNRGFYIKGEKKSTCEATGQWSSPTPTCHPVSCSEPPKVENGFLEHATGRIFESEARYRCNPGYKAVGSPVFVCQANRHWYSESPLSCIPLNCGKPPPIQNGYMKGEIFEVGSKVQFFCNEGYELIGDHSWTCLKSGKWNKKPNQKCVPSRCPEPPLLENQLVLKELASEVGMVTFSCKEGHALQGPPVLKCLLSQQWNDSFPVCKMVLCLPPPLIPFGVPAPSSSLHFGSTVEYSCVDGFFLRGNPTTSCQADGTWSSPLPECVPVECPQPEEILNGIIDVQGLAYLSTALYTCKPGYELVGNTTTLCGENGHWLGGKPTCKPIECPKPKEILNGKFSYTDLHYGQSVIYSCDRGFRLQGPKALTCLETGDWDVDVPSCSAIHCNPPQAIENGFVEGADYSFGAMIIYSCFPGFHVAGHAMQTCEESGWSGSIPTCVTIDCGLPPHIDFGDCTKVKGGQGYFDQEEDLMEVPYRTPLPPHHLGAVTKSWENTKGSPTTHLAHFPHGTMVSYTCNPGYELLGNPILICQEDGTWNGSAPSCISVECDLPVAPENGFLHFTETTMGSAIQYSCKPGHILVGSDIRLCLQNREWSGASPTCEAISCKKPNPVMNGSVKGSNYTYLSVVFYECNPGYVLNGNERRTCQQNKNWDGNEPICIPVDCGSPPVSANGQVKGDEYTFQKEVEYTCNVGFLLEGARSRVCLADGNWSGTTPLCVPVRCATPPQLTNGVMDGLDYGFGKEVVFHCQEGYVLHGAPRLTCQSDGNWDTEFPFCKPVNCGPPEDLPHGFSNGFSFYHGGHIQYQCFPGYKLHGSPSRRCIMSTTFKSTVGLVNPWRGQLRTDLIVLVMLFFCFVLFCFLHGSAIPLSFESVLICHIKSPLSVGNIILNPRISHQLYCTLFKTLIWLFHSRCLEGYMMDTTVDTFTCQKDGHWFPETISCSPKKCLLPANITRIRVHGDDFSVNKQVSVSCEEGYIYEGVNISTCQLDGTWEPPFSDDSCSPVSCGKPESPEHGFVFGSKFTFESTVIYQCEPGYELEGNKERVCQKNRMWSGEVAVCKKTRCEAPLGFLNGKAKVENTAAGPSVVYSCNRGYSLEGAPEAYCTENGAWSHPVPFCKPNPCPVPFVIPENALLSEKEFYVDQNVSIKCREGFLLQGRGVITCNPDETWTLTSAKCEKISCGPPTFVENAITRGVRYQYGDMITYSCYSGYMLEGPLRSVCLENGTWTSPPVCRAVCRFPCQNGGICQRPNACSCPDGWMGRLCEEPICILPCLNGGRCVAPYQCDCPPGWTGSRCHTAVCQSPCLNGGKCIRPNRCHCLSAWTGHDCSRKRRTGF
uniref:sushi, von Willebrand factor type A, EGF and pentraxin domain-containing protein 1 n=1 Tax=Panthera onca TaxID=9690 RepID=UPI0029547E57|nr:sushi, von Willebrand factor type A, EGF and pentraxin domain-containing protein 1 [Panthera onca]